MVSTNKIHKKILLKIGAVFEPEDLQFIIVMQRLSACAAFQFGR